MRERRSFPVFPALFRLGIAVVFSMMTACVNVQPKGIIYTDIRLPLTHNFHNTTWPISSPNSARTLEIKEPFTGFGLYAQVDSNAIGSIARKNGMNTLYFADRQIFSILGIWTSNKTILYGQ